MWRLLASALALLIVTGCSDSEVSPPAAAADTATGAASDASSSDVVVEATEETTTYGVTDFEATGSAEAYPVFLRGLLQLHNFEFEDSRETFREAQEIDPDFYMRGPDAEAAALEPRGPGCRARGPCETGPHTRGTARTRSHGT